MVQDVISVVFALIAMIAVIVLAYYASRWYARRVGVFGGAKHMKVVDRLVVSRNGSIIILDLDGEQYMVGISDSNIQIMKQLETPIPFERKTAAEIQKMSFGKALKTVIQQKVNADEDDDRN
ncbi:MAG: flagellar biosynthetic protein FliO [Clostridia bacterium]|nr:flagellar biosynthetic protein FliO [Clostridia bacterium]